MLYGNQESVCKKFQQDNQDKKFSNQKAVTLKIQLIAKRYTLAHTLGPI